MQLPAPQFSFPTSRTANRNEGGRPRRAVSFARRYDLRADATLVSLACNSDVGAQLELFARHGERLFHFCHWFIGEPGRAERIAQDAFLETFRVRRHGAPGRPFVVDVFREGVRLCQRERQPAATGSPGNDAAKRVREAIDRLPGDEAAALLLSRIDGFSRREIAECLACTVDAAERLLSRATGALRSELHDLLSAGGGGGLFGR